MFGGDIYISSFFPVVAVCLLMDKSIVCNVRRECSMEITLQTVMPGAGGKKYLIHVSTEREWRIEKKVSGSNIRRSLITRFSNVILQQPEL